MDEQANVEQNPEESAPSTENEVTPQAVEEGESATQEQAEEETQESAPEEVSDVQKRINKLTAEKYAAKREKEELERRLAEVANSQAVPSNVADQKPTLEQYDYDEDKYHEALIDWKVAKQVQASAQISRQRQQQEGQTKYNATVAGFASKTPDFYDSVGSIPLQNDAAAKAILALDNGPEVAYHLSKNLHIVDSLNGADPNKAVMEIGRLSERLLPSKKKSTTSAPAPVKPIGSGGGVKESWETEAQAGATYE